jgi:hypothetical protein
MLLLYQHWTQPSAPKVTMNQLFTGFYSGERIERHHTILNKNDPARDDPQNLRVVHQVCHEQIHSGHRPTVSGALIRAA